MQTRGAEEGVKALYNCKPLYDAPTCVTKYPHRVRIERSNNTRQVPAGDAVHGGYETPVKKHKLNFDEVLRLPSRVLTHPILLCCILGRQESAFATVGERSDNRRTQYSRREYGCLVTKY